MTVGFKFRAYPTPEQQNQFKSPKNRIDNILKYVVSIELIVPVYAVKEKDRLVAKAEKLLKKVNIPYRISTETAPFLEKH